jgi:hypothetical protein
MVCRLSVAESNILYDEETEELSEDYENLSGDIADLTKTASTPGGISLFTDETKETYKSTYQILKEISQIFDEMSDKNQANNPACMYRNVHIITRLKPVKPKALSLQCG